MPRDNDVVTVPPEPEWAAFLAIDWADRKHHWKWPAPIPNRLNKAKSTTPRKRSNAGQRNFIPSSAVVRLRSVWSSRAELWCICCRSTRTWSCTRCARPLWLVSGRRSILAAAQAIRAILMFYWIYCCITAIPCDGSKRTRRRPACCQSVQQWFDARIAVDLGAQHRQHRRLKRGQHHAGSDELRTGSRQ